MRGRGLKEISSLVQLKHLNMITMFICLKELHQRLSGGGREKESQPVVVIIVRVHRRNWKCRGVGTTKNGWSLGCEQGG